jgi:hypothetical protein
MSHSIVIRFAFVFLVLVSACSGSAPRSNHSDGPSYESNALTISSCQYVTEDEAHVALSMVGPGVRTAVTWRNIAGLSTVAADGTTNELAWNYVAPRSSNGPVAITLKAPRPPKQLLVEGLVTTRGPAIRLGVSGGVDGLAGLSIDFGQVEGTVGKVKETEDGVVLEIRFHDSSNLEGQQLMGVDDLRIRRGSVELLTRITSSRVVGSDDVTQIIGLSPLRPTESAHAGGVTLTSAGLAFRLNKTASVAWPETCRPS